MRGAELGRKPAIHGFPKVIAGNTARAVEVLRTGIRQGTELCTLATHQKSFHEFISQIGPGKGKLTSALQKRDEKFGDYRTTDKSDD